jgi:hypothetical protein
LLKGIVGLLAASVLALTGCSDPLCTNVGCSDGVLIKLSRAIPDSFAVEVETLDFTAVQIFPEGHDGDRVFFEDFTPDQGTVRVGWATATVETTLVFTYVEGYPNGPDCGSVCRQASVAIDLP